MIECTGCGQCCLTEKCLASDIATGSEDNTICPFLHFINPDFYRCMLVEMESWLDMPPLVKQSLGIGVGCTNGYKKGSGWWSKKTFA